MDKPGEKPNNPVSSIVPTDRRVTRSVARALDPQVVGSILTQIDTGISRSVDFVPTEYLNRCADLVLGRTTGNGASSLVRITSELSVNESSNSMNFSQKLENIVSMPNNNASEVDNPPGGACGNDAATAVVEGEGSQLSQLMRMMNQQNLMLSNCLSEMARMRVDFSSLSQRVGDIEGPGHTTTMNDPGSSSTPERGPTQASGNNTRSLEDDIRKEGHGVNSNQNDIGPNRSGRGTADISYSRSEMDIRKSVDLDRWHIKFDGSGKDMTVESFIFRIEKLREQHNITHNQLFSNFHCLVSGNASKWYWQVLEDHADDIDFNYFALKRELKAHFKSADSDYEIIREIMDCKQQPGQTFEEFYAEIHDLTFRLRKKMPEEELVHIVRGNLRHNVASLIFSSSIDCLADLKRECKRAEKLLKDMRSRNKPINEIAVENSGEEVNLDAIGMNSKGAGYQNRNDNFSKARYQQDNMRKVPKERLDSSLPTSNINSPADNTTLGRNNQKVFCMSHFHLNLCYTCGMPADFFRKNLESCRQEDVCKSTFHDMECFVCGKGDSFLEYRPSAVNVNVAEVTGYLCRPTETPEEL